MSSVSTPASEWEWLTPEPSIAPASVPTPPNSIEKLTYQRLGENTIRLLVVRPGKQNEPIQCDLSEVAHNSGTSYEALSYTWGSSEYSQSIAVSKKHLLVGWNLYHALKSLRLSDKARTIWVDALCINQDDILERNEQVLLMKRIYQKAKNVLVYLGESSDDIDVALSDSMASQLRLVMPRTISPDFNAKRAKALMTLFYRPYWRRVWIIQEILSASNLEILCGTNSIPWLHFMSMLEEVTTNMSPIQYLHDVGNACAKSPAAEIIRVRRDGGGTYSFKELLDLCSICGSECKDLRDRIYGLISLSRDVKNKLVPDYTKSIPQQYLDVFVTWLSSFSHYSLDERRDWLGFMKNLQRVLQDPLWHLQAYTPLHRIARPIQLSKMQNTLRFIWLKGLSRVDQIGPAIMTNEKEKAKEHVLDWELHANGSVLRHAFTCMGS